MLLPDHLIAVVPAEALVDHAEQALERVPAGEGGRRPRAMTFVTGPSRTADIEEVLLLGAHGPRALSILLVDPS
jgi:L-lactate dehydrogenase complex protein LldG